MSGANLVGAGVRLAALVGVMTALTGCIAVGSNQMDPPTRGEQLVDLKAAYDVGAISQEEYERERLEIINSTDDCDD